MVLCVCGSRTIISQPGLPVGKRGSIIVYYFIHWCQTDYRSYADLLGIDGSGTVEYNKTSFNLFNRFVTRALQAQELRRGGETADQRTQHSAPVHSSFTLFIYQRCYSFEILGRSRLSNIKDFLGCLDDLWILIEKLNEIKRRVKFFMKRDSGYMFIPYVRNPGKV